MRKFLSLLAFSLPLFSQTNAALPPPMHLRFLDNTGKPLAGGKIYTCSAGTACPGNPLATYTDATATVQNPNPVILDAGGYASIWIGASSYKFVAQNATGVPQWTQDNVASTALATGSSLSGSLLSGTGATLIGYTPALSGAVVRTVATKLAERLSVKDFGATGDGATDDTTAIQAACAAASSSHQAIWFNPGVYLISSPLTSCNLAQLSLLGEPGQWMYNSPVGTAVIRAKSTFSGGSDMLPLTATASSAARITIRDLTIDCNGVSGLNAVHIGNTAHTGGYGHFLISHNSFTGCSSGVGLFAESALGGIVEDNQISGNGRGIWFYATGDSKLVNNSINTNLPDHIPTSISDPLGSGIVLSAGSNNVNILGGKIEWNARGILIYSTQGVNITGVQFDTNKTNQIVAYSDIAGVPQYNARSISITGCRFLGGATNREATATVPRTAVFLGAMGGSAQVSATISGNSFRKAGAAAFDENTTDAVGPVDDAIVVYANSPQTATATVSGNDLYNSSSTNAVTAIGTGAVVTMGSNANNLPLAGTFDNTYAASKLYVGQSPTTANGSAPLNVAGQSGSLWSGYNHAYLPGLWTTGGTINESIHLDGNASDGLGSVNGQNLSHPISWAITTDTHAFEWYKKTPTTPLSSAGLIGWIDINGTMNATGYRTTGGAVGYTGTVSCAAGTHINSLTITGGIITAQPTCN